MSSGGLTDEERSSTLKEGKEGEFVERGSRAVCMLLLLLLLLLVVGL